MRCVGCAEELPCLPAVGSHSSPLLPDMLQVGQGWSPPCSSQVRPVPHTWSRARQGHQGSEHGRQLLTESATSGCRSLYKGVKERRALGGQVTAAPPMLAASPGSARREGFGVLTGIWGLRRFSAPGPSLGATAAAAEGQRHGPAPAGRAPRALPRVWGPALGQAQGRRAPGGLPGREGLPAPPPPPEA